MSKPQIVVILQNLYRERSTSERTRFVIHHQSTQTKAPRPPPLQLVILLSKMGTYAGHARTVPRQEDQHSMMQLRSGHSSFVPLFRRKRARPSLRTLLTPTYVAYLTPTISSSLVSKEIKMAATTQKPPPTHPHILYDRTPRLITPSKPHPPCVDREFSKYFRHPALRLPTNASTARTHNQPLKSP